jgi:LysR family transcriptional regulator, glycine cleavage system transcriptional activator
MDSIDWLRFPPLSALRALEATVRLGGFSAAARALNVTHAAVAQQVRGLEAHLGYALVHREGRTLSVTDEARRLADAANDGFVAIQTALNAIDLGRRNRTLAVTMTPIFAERWLMPRLKGFWAAHPDISLSLRPDHRVYDLRREGVDLGIRYGHGRWPGVEAEYLVSARFMIVAAPDLLRGVGDLSPEYLSRQPWIVEEGGAEPESWLMSHGIDISAAPRTLLPTEELALSAARQGIGLHVASAALIERDIADDALRVVLDSRDDNPAYYLVAPPGPRSPAARLFAKWLKAQT